MKLSINFKLRQLQHDDVCAKYEVRLYAEGISINANSKPSFLGPGIPAVSCLRVKENTIINFTQNLKGYYVLFGNSKSSTFQMIYTSADQME